ncbi:MAG TPA: branched-chain amino acid ABC transporter permease [Burkholderiales bacterium]
MINALTYPIRRAYTQLRTEVLSLPSRTIVLVFALALLLLPLYSTDPYLMRIVIMASIFAIYAASWDLLAGFTGQVNFGHALFFGLGAYGSSLLNHHFGLSPWITIPIGAVVATLGGVLVGIPCLRLRGSYLSLATLAFPLILTGILFAFPDFSGGELGISGLRRLFVKPVHNYYAAVILMLVLCFAMWKISTSNTGLIFHAIREDEVAARASGINTKRYKLLAFALSAFFAGIAGAFFAHFIRIAGPSTLEVALSFQAVIWGIFGGVATIYGPIVAVFILYPLTEAVAVFPELREFRLLILAVVVLLVLLFMPQGLTPWLRDKIESICQRCKNRNVFWRRECRICSTAMH